MTPVVTLMDTTLDMKIMQQDHEIVIRFPHINFGSQDLFETTIPDFFMSETPPDFPMLSRRATGRPDLYFSLAEEGRTFSPHEQKRRADEYIGYHPTTISHLAFSQHHGLILSRELPRVSLCAQPVASHAGCLA